MAEDVDGQGDGQDEVQPQVYEDCDESAYCDDQPSQDQFMFYGTRGRSTPHPQRRGRYGARRGRGRGRGGRSFRGRWRGRGRGRGQRLRFTPRRSASKRYAPKERFNRQRFSSGGHLQFRRARARPGNNGPSFDFTHQAQRWYRRWGKSNTPRAFAMRGARAEQLAAAHAKHDLRAATDPLSGRSQPSSKYVDRFDTFLMSAPDFKKFGPIEKVVNSFGKITMATSAAYAKRAFDAFMHRGDP